MATYPIKAVAKPRMTRADKWKKPPRKCVARYRAFSDECRLRIGTIDLNGVSITWHIKMPQSWPIKKKQAMAGQPHESVPDLSNLLKSIEDALYSKRHTGRDDCTIHHIGELRKVWSWFDQIEID